MSSAPDDPTLPGIGAAPTGADEPRHVSRDRYRLGATLGEGGMAVVVEAHDANLKRPVAIKQMRDELRDDPSARQRFFHEAEILASLDHTGLVAVHEAGIFEDGRPFYAMAKVRGLRSAVIRSSSSSRPSRRRCRWTRDGCRARCRENWRPSA